MPWRSRACDHLLWRCSLVLCPGTADGETSEASGSAAPERPDFDRPDLGDRMAGCDFDGFLEALGLDDVEAADGLLRLRERAIGHDRLSVAYSHGPRAPGRRE